ncbi:ribonuclease D [Idiomarina tyrosinivorans]|uniref:ribonuclease D n=1 Tax=Idiomarina tyrosinivorans TaxID=1445662 RepID=UPI0018E5447B|nr:ribonuclease D [Idiomarina tyrosinivorans]
MIKVSESLLQYRIIDNDSALESFLHAQQPCHWIAIDTEFVRERTYYAELGLVQLSVNGETVVIDPLTINDLTPLWNTVNAPEVATVVHAGGEDIELFYHCSGGNSPQRIFDTQIAATVLGLGDAMGYARLVEHFCGVELDKSQSRTNWLKRPLAPQQLDYAAADASYLAAIYPELLRQARQAGVEELIWEESQRQVSKRTQQIPDDLRYLFIGNAWQLNMEQLQRLQRLTAWRFHKARKRNLPLGFLLKDGALLDVARKCPKNLAQLSAINGVSPATVKYSGKDILQVLDGERYNQLPAPQHTLLRLDDMADYKRCFKAIKQWVGQVAESLNVPPSFVASRKQINDVMFWCWQISSDQQQRLPKPDLFVGWRDARLGADIRELLRPQ